MMFHVKHALDVQRILGSQGLIVTDTKRDQLTRFVEEVIGWNAKINLISRKDEEQVWFSHVLHSLTPLLFVGIPDGATVLDLGSGGGFPGVPMAILREDLRFTLLDSIRKKTAALQQIVSALHLQNVNVVTGRAEEAATVAAHRGSFDCVIARAVAPLGDLIRWSRPLVRRSDRSAYRTVQHPLMPLRVPSLIAMKGGDLSGEVRTAELQEKASHIEVIDIVFHGSEEIGLEEKKLVVVPL